MNTLEQMNNTSTPLNKAEYAQNCEIEFIR